MLNINAENKKLRLCGFMHEIPSNLALDRRPHAPCIGSEFMRRFMIWPLFFVFVFTTYS